MSGHKAKKHRERQEAIMFGKMCGCGYWHCKYCAAFELEYIANLIDQQFETKHEQTQNEYLRKLAYEQQQIKR